MKNFDASFADVFKDEDDIDCIADELTDITKQETLQNLLKVFRKYA